MFDSKSKYLEYSKIESYNSMAAMLKAFAHPTRLGVLFLLESNESMSVTEIVGAMDCEQAHISQHLRQLKMRGILGTKREGKFVFYFLKEESCGGLVAIFNKMEINRTLDG